MEFSQGKIWNLSDKSLAICERVIKAHLPADIIKNLKSEMVRPNLMHEELRRLVVCGFLSILHNVVRRVPAAREVSTSLRCSRLSTR